MSSEKHHLLIIDDDHEILDILTKYFGSRGYQVTTYSDPEQALEDYQGLDCDLIVLDLHMPGMDGFTVCREVRKQSSIPIIILTGESAETDKVVGLELGADDYVTKPFSSRELEARVKARLRTLPPAPTPESAPEQARDQLQFDQWTLDTARHELLNADGEVVPLTGGEYRLLKAFVDHPNRVLSRDQLMDWTKGHEAGPFDRSIDVQVARLRKKLGDPGPDYRLLKTFRGEGYLLSAKVRPESRKS